MKSKEIMKVSIFTPTRLPGIDVTHSSILRQEFKQDTEINWIISDQLYDKRVEEIEEKLKKWPYEYYHFTLPIRDGNKRNLAESYNEAIRIARDWDSDIFVSLQDYIYVPCDGLQKFIDVHNGVDAPYLLTGICHISSDPVEEKIWDLNGAFTIFKEPYTSMPKRIHWHDVRKGEDRIQNGIYQTFPTEWEANWSMVGKQALYDKELMFDEKFDKFIAYENQDYALNASSRGYKVLLDPNNEVISLPHKKYFPHIEKSEAPLTSFNRDYLISKEWVY